MAHTITPDPDGMTYVQMCCWSPIFEPTEAAITEAEEREGISWEDAHALGQTEEHAAEVAPAPMPDEDDETSDEP